MINYFHNNILVYYLYYNIFYKLFLVKILNLYNNAIECWTKRDVNKRNIAKQNNLNYIEFWNINELINYINKET